MKIQESLEKLNKWVNEQENLRLVLGKPLSDEEISSIPQQIADMHNHFLTVKFNPEDFPIPESYREFLKLHSYARLEYRMDEDEEWKVYEPFNIFSKKEVIEAPSFTDPGTTANGDREIYTTFLIAFATAGYSTEASRWCFYTDKDQRKSDKELPIFLEENDYEVNTAKYVDTKEWIEDAPLQDPVCPDFQTWFKKLVKKITSKPFDPEIDDEIPDSFF